MAYNKTLWVNDSIPAINAGNLNKIEQGIYEAHENVGDLTQLETTDKSNIVNAINEVRFEEYSTTEQVIGKWLDGKPIYRKVIQYSARILTGLVSIPHNINNLKLVTNIQAVTLYDNKTYTMPLLYSNVSTASYINYVDSNNIVLKLGENWDLYTMYITIEYTKTID